MKINPAKGKSKFNDEFVSRTDPEARVSQKRNKPPALNHLGIISVDAENHVICGAAVDFADKRDADTIQKIVEQTLDNLEPLGFGVKEVLADTGYSSGVAYNFLEENNITAYIPPHGRYKHQREGFIYDEKEDCYSCTQGVKLPFRHLKTEKDTNLQSKRYCTTVADCRNCPLKQPCCKKQDYKQIEHSIDKHHYDKAYRLLKTRKGKYKMRLRKSTVEPVLGTLLHFRGMKKVYTIGNELAHKQLLMASAAYNLKKFMNFNPTKNIKIAAMAIKNSVEKSIPTCLYKILLLVDRILFGWNYKMQKCII
jgi:hypothetical protein